jgi:hypothetical protein
MTLEELYEKYRYYLDKAEWNVGNSGMIYAELAKSVALIIVAKERS